MTTRTRFLVGGTALIAVVLFVSTRVLSQENAPPNPAGQEQMDEMMAKWAQANAKGPEHQKLADMVGTWETETKMWFAPGTPPTVAKGTAHFRLILDGRYVEQKFVCPEMGQPGAPFEGRAIEGYDRTKKKYVSIWMDNTSTGIFISQGTYDESANAFTYIGKMDDPMTGQKDKVVKSVARQITKDKVIFEMYDTPPDGSEFKSMEITYTRKK